MLNSLQFWLRIKVTFQLYWHFCIDNDCRGDTGSTISYLATLKRKYEDKNEYKTSLVTL